MYEFVTKNLYFSVCVVALVAAFATYIYFYNQDVLGAGPVTEDLTGEGSGSSSEITSIVVDISGAVESPGIYSLDPGSRLAELLLLAGGVTDEVSEKWLSRSMNMSAILYDQQKIYVPFVWEVASSPPEYVLEELVLESRAPASDRGESVEEPAGVTSDPSSPASPIEEPATDGGVPVAPETSESVADHINLNEASQDELKELTGVGDVWSERIIENRPYTGFDDFQEKTGATDNFVDKIRDSVRF
jgi:competence protein ComEA